MRRILTFLIYALILGGSVFSLFYMFRIQGEEKKKLDLASDLHQTFRSISKIAIAQIEPNDLKPLYEIYNREGKNPGLAIGITYGIRTFPYYFGSTGEKKHPIDETTLFEIGSLTQTFTGLWLARMIDQGRLPEDPLLNQVLGSSTPLNLKSIRLIDLATHSAGFPKMPPNFPAPAPQNLSNPNNPFADYSSDSLWESLRSIQPEKIGTYEYSNYGFAALGASLSRFRGAPYPALLRQEILEPLGLSTMRFGTEGEPPAPYHFAIPHQNGKIVPRLPLHTFDPAGGLCTTLPDLLKYINTMTYPDRSPFPKTVQLTLKTWKKNESNLGLGLGWYISPHPFGTILWKSGGAGGYRAYIGFWDDLPLGVVLLANSNDELIDQIGFQLLQSLRQLPTK